VALLSGDQISNIIAPDAVEKAIAEIDVDGDGEIDFEEFILMMKKA